MLIAHFFPETLAFADSAIRLFDKTGYDNCYFCLSAGKDGRGSSFAEARTKWATLEEIERYCAESSADVYMFHALPGYFYDSVLAIPEGRKVIVSSWGYDIYDSQNGCPPLCSIPLYKSDTQELLNRMAREKAKRIRKEAGILRSFLRPVKHFLLRSRYQRWQQAAEEKQRRVVNRIDYWATVLPTEYEVLKTNPSVRAEFFPFKYISSSYPEPHPTSRPDGVILLGNSSTPSNNHLDILHVLRERKITNPVYIPLAYGDGEYLQELERIIPGMGIQCYLQKEFMPPQAYNEQIANCRVGIFGHLRQQSLGNITLFLYFGKKVFLWRDSLAFQFYKKQGCFVFSIEEDLSNQEILNPLSEEEITHNREIVSLLTSDSLIFSQTKLVLDKIAAEL